MKRVLLLCLCAGCIAVPARADYIALHAESYSDLCVKQVTPFVMTSVYVFHVLSDGARGSAWRVENSTAMLSAGSSCAGIGIQGDPYTGIWLNYNGCRTGTFPICQLNLMSFSLPPIPGCYHLRVLPAPGDPYVIAVDCTSVPQAATGGYFSFDPDEKLPPCDDCATPVESRTWGSVKALYR